MPFNSCTKPSNVFLKQTQPLHEDFIPCTKLEKAQVSI